MKHIRTINESRDWDEDPYDQGPDPEPYHITELKPAERLFDVIAMSTVGGLLKRKGTNELWWMDLEGEEVSDAMEAQGYWPRWNDDEGTPLDFDEVDRTAFADFLTDLYRGNTRNLGEYKPTDFLGDGLKNWFVSHYDEKGKYLEQEDGEGGIKPIVKIDPPLAEELIKEIGRWYFAAKPREIKGDNSGRFFLGNKYLSYSYQANTLAYRKIVDTLARAYPPQKS
jgi:hypothetical protein